jgi:hypothetical protein
VTFYEADAPERFAIAVHEIVDYDDVVAAVQQFDTRVRADKTRAARYQNRALHGHAVAPLE